MPPTGLLAVFIDLGSQVTEQEFHEWYGEEHIPLRTSTLREFATAARFKLIDGVGSVSAPSKAVPRWAALYTISDNAIFRKEAYTKLRANRSPREADLVKRLGLLDRRIYAQTSSPSDNPSPTDAAPSLVIVHSLTPSQDVGSMLNSADERFAALPGFLRTRRFRNDDTVRSGVFVDEGSENASKDVGEVLQLVEFTSSSILASSEWSSLASWLDASLAPLASYRSLDAYELWKAYEPTAALSPS